MSKPSGHPSRVSRIASIAACALATFFVSGVAGATSFAVAGFGDSLTFNTNSGGDFDGSYLGHLGLTEGAGGFFDGGAPAETSADIEARLITFLASNTADFVVIMAGTVDAYDVGGPYSETTTLGNIEDMIDAVLAANLVPIVISPPPVAFPCDTNNATTCNTVNSRLLSLAAAVETLVTAKAMADDVRFIDAFDAFVNDPGFLVTPGDPASLYLLDGLHLQFGTGDDLIGGLVLTAIPEPGTGALMGLGLLGLALGGRRRRCA